MTLITLRAIRHYFEGREPSRILEPEATEAAVAVVLSSEEDSRPRVLLIKRAERAGDPWSGQMALPGGRRDPADTNLFRTAVRETQEETGVVLDADRFIGELDDLYPRTAILPPVVVRPFAFALSLQPRVCLNDEVKTHVWASLAELKAGQRVVEVSVQGRPMHVSAYRIGPYTIWGMTHRILKPLIDLA